MRRCWYDRKEACGGRGSGLNSAWAGLGNVSRTTNTGQSFRCRNDVRSLADRQTHMGQPTDERRRQLFDGRAGDSLFSTPFLQFFRENELSPLFQKVERLDDHRLLAVITALVVENRVDRINAAFLPQYTRLIENSDFVFSTKIALLEALNFVPLYITMSAHCLRRIRNEFAHNLERETLNDLPEKVINSMRPLYGEIYRDFKPKAVQETTLFEMFKLLSFYCIWGLDSYIVNVEALRGEISGAEFLDHLSRRVRSRNWSEYQQIIARPPISVEKHGDTLIKRYEGGVVEVTPTQDPVKEE